jgi:hypothetical protein
MLWSVVTPVAKFVQMHAGGNGAGGVVVADAGAGDGAGVNVFGSVLTAGAVVVVVVVVEETGAVAGAVLTRATAL